MNLQGGAMELYTDSSWQKGIAGIGIYVIDGVKTRQISNCIPCENNNLGEMFAIKIACILAGGKKATIYTDSQTAIDYIKGNVRPKTPSDFKYKSQWIAYNQMKVLAYEINQINPNITFEKVKAHRHDFRIGHLNNAMADILAKQGYAKSLGR